ncbi:hypothetical protein D3C77_604050 [compost metagenome]
MSPRAFINEQILNITIVFITPGRGVINQMHKAEDLPLIVNGDQADQILFLAQADKGFFGDFGADIGAIKVQILLPKMFPTRSI